MKRVCWVLILAVCMTVSLRAEEPPAAEAPAAAKQIAVVNAAGLDDALFQRVVEHLEKNLFTEMRVLPAREPVGGKTIEVEAEALKGLVTGNVDLEPARFYRVQRHNGVNGPMDGPRMAFAALVVSGVSGSPSVQESGSQVNSTLHLSSTWCRLPCLWPPARPG